MQKIEAGRRNWAFEPPPLLAVLFAPALAVACGGPAAPLYDVLDEAQERVDHVLAALDDTEDEMNEATGAELPPCPSHYEPPPLSTGQAPYEDVVERPAELGDPVEERELVNRHARHCRESGRSLQGLQNTRQQLRSAYEGFADYAQAMGDFIADDMTSEQIGTLSAEIEAVAAARPDEEDTLRQRYERLNDWIIGRSPLVREMSLVATRRGSRFMPAMLPAAEDIEGLVPNIVGEWTTIIENHTEARNFFRIRNDYRRRIYEGPDAVDPDEAAADWTPLAGVWTGEYANTRLAGGWSTPTAVEITFDSNGDGATISVPGYCRESLQLTSRTEAFGRVTEYDLTGGGCRIPSPVILDRTAEDKLRLYWNQRNRSFRQSGGVSGYLIRQ